MKMQDCPSFEKCAAPLCPLDSDLKSRIWYIDEPICYARAQGGKHRWIRKQRSIVKRQTKTWLDRPVTYQQLFDASRPRKLSEEQRAAIGLRLAKINPYMLKRTTEPGSARVT